MPAVALDLVVRQLRQVAVGLRPRRSRSGYRALDSSRDGRDDADCVARSNGRLFFLQIADVLVVDVDVDEAAELALLVVKMRLQPGVLRRQVRQQLTYGRAVGVNCVFLVRDTVGAVSESGFSSP